MKNHSFNTTVVIEGREIEGAIPCEVSMNCGVVTVTTNHGEDITEACKLQMCPVESLANNKDVTLLESLTMDLFYNIQKYQSC